MFHEKLNNHAVFLREVEIHLFDFRAIMKGRFTVVVYLGKNKFSLTYFSILHHLTETPQKGNF